MMQTQTHPSRAELIQLLARSFRILPDFKTQMRFQECLLQNIISPEQEQYETAGKKKSSGGTHLL